jgi:hypothetical protein
VQPSPLATLANPVDTLQARLARVNRNPGASGITAITQDNGTPLLTNRAESVDRLSDREVGSVVDPGQGGDPRAMLRELIASNFNTGQAESVNRATDPLMLEAQGANRVRSVDRDFAREQSVLDAGAKAEGFFHPRVTQQRGVERGHALEEMEAKTRGALAAANADVYGSELDAEAQRYTADRAFEGNALRALGGAYGDEQNAASISGPVREQGGAAILRQLIQQLLTRGAPNAQP